MNMEQKHLFEERQSERHNTVFFSQEWAREVLQIITFGECLCGELFFIHTEKEFAGERSLKTLWRAHAKGRKKNEKVLV